MKSNPKEGKNEQRECRSPNLERKHQGFELPLLAALPFASKTILCDRLKKALLVIFRDNNACLFQANVSNFDFTPANQNKTIFSARFALAVRWGDHEIAVYFLSANHEIGLSSESNAKTHTAPTLHYRIFRAHLINHLIHETARNGSVLRTKLFAVFIDATVVESYKFCAQSIRTISYLQTNNYYSFPLK